MPAQSAVPKIADFRDAASKSIRGFRDPRISVRTGGSYDTTQGSTAVLMARQAKRDQGLFRQCYVETSRGADRDRLVEAYYKVERTQRTYGTGTLILVNVPGTTLKVYAGTPFEVSGAGGVPAVYEVSADVDFGETGTQPYLSLPIRASRAGSGVAVNASGSQIRFGLGAEYILGIDSGLTPVSLVCGDGTNYEKDDDYLARAKVGRRDGRVGHLKRIIQACKDAGAHNVVALHSGTFGDASDAGLNYVYVSDANFITSDALKQACFLALDAVRVLGCDTQVLGMNTVQHQVTVAAHLWDDPGLFDQVDIKQGITAALFDFFNARSNWWIFTDEELAGVLMRTSDAIQSIDLVVNPPAPAAEFPIPALLRYKMQSDGIFISLTGPQ